MTPAYTPDIIAPIDAPFERGPQLRWFDAMDDPRLNVTAELMAPDFVTAAKARALPPFAVLFHAISGASLDVDAFRWRLTDQGEPFRINALLPSYTVQNTQGHVNFSYVPFTEDLDAFVKAYHADKHEAETATGMRTNVKAAPECGQLYCTGLPFLRFTSIEHPRSGGGALAATPNIAAGQWRREAEGQLSLPLSVQTHHGLVDGVHVAAYFDAVRDRLARFVGG
ncbi:CatA-like O-acetyltransferase [Oceanicaulis sp.]|uniref:CatA-like O-acetyltransferase n=1 Tax=Oceanicaulis sp. TaxID=1924941 RepID=UPI003F71F2A7